jgi:hypothetical protein
MLDSNVYPGVIHLADNSSSQLRQEYEARQMLFNNQPVTVQHFLRSQAQQSLETLALNPNQVQFSLPDFVVNYKSSDEMITMHIPATQRQQKIRIWAGRQGKDILAFIQGRLVELEQSKDSGIALGALLVHHALAVLLVQNPLLRQPRQVAFDEKGNLLVGSIGEAESCLVVMRRMVEALESAVKLAPYMVADPEYQRNRYGLLGQFVSQGQALARYQTIEVIKIVKNRSIAQRLNRGLSLSLPFFDDQELAMRLYHFTVIPTGRILFVPAFAVLATRREQVKVAQDIHLSPSTRKHLSEMLELFGGAFITLENCEG